MDITDKECFNIKMSLLTNLANDSQVYRGSVPKAKKPIFKKELSNVIGLLIKKADNNTLTNKDIRRAINDLSSKTGLKTGVSQKVINVYMKYYCAISNKKKILKELDCPIDSMVKNMYHLKQLPLKNINSEEYLNMQKTLKSSCDGVRIRADIKAYDQKKSY